MTGELSDVFPSRAAGVAYLVGLMRKATGENTLFYSLRDGLIGADAVRDHWQDVASANWHASATLTASLAGDGLLIDIGTTTTDLVPLRDGKSATIGLNDGERLTEGELIYGGVVRTPVMAMAQTAPFKGRMQGIAAERFATMADVYRLTGELPEDADPYPAADQRGKSLDESAARLARMLGRDADDADFIAWKALAPFPGAAATRADRGRRESPRRPREPRRGRAPSSGPAAAASSPKPWPGGWTVPIAISPSSSIARRRRGRWPPAALPPWPWVCLHRRRHMTR